MGFFDFIVGKDNTDTLKQMLQEGAVVIDVRTPGEYQGGHVKGAKNIPLQEINSKQEQIMAIKTPVIFCCASGGRSGQATDFFKSKGLNCENGGPWTKVNALV